MGTIASSIERIQQAKADIKVSIENAGVSVPSEAKIDTYSTYIDAIGTSGSRIPELDVIFIDYDGTIVASYTAVDFALLAELPENPTHSGLTAQGWNWTLSEAKDYVSSYGKLVIGQMYVTTSGATEIDFSLEYAQQTVSIAFAVDGTMSIDWGDNTTPDTITGASPGTRLSQSHTYTNAGNYTISLKESSGTYRLQGASDSFSSPQSAILGSYSSSITSIRIGTGLPHLSGACLKYCYGLKSLSIPNTVQQFQNNAFEECSSLKAIVLPTSFVSLGTKTIYLCSSLEYISFPYKQTGIDLSGDSKIIQCSNLKIITMPVPPSTSTVTGNLFYEGTNLKLLVIPEGVTAIGSSFAMSCSSLPKIVIPESVTSLGINALSYCTSLKYIILLSSVPPSLAGYNFQNLPNDACFCVPANAVETYKGATGWIDFASQIIANPF